MATRMLQRRGTAAEWAALNPVLSNGEIGFETDTQIIKVGDGETAWNDLSLPYVMSAGGTMTGPLTMVEPTQPNHGARLSEINALQLGLREIVTFTANDSFVKASYPWLRAVRVRVQGGGGGGGGSEATSAGESSVGRGGSAGAFAVGFVLASALDASVSVTVGEGGAAGPANITGGSSGGASSFGAFVNGPGGGGAGGGIAAGAGGVTFPSGARSGAPAGTHVIHGKRGDGGGFAFRISGIQALSGFGASSPHGAGGAANASGAVGSAGLGPGAGGGGAQSRDGEAARVGGDGGDGIVIVELYS